MKPREMSDNHLFLHPKRLINDQWHFVWILSHHFLQCPSAGICEGGSLQETLDYQNHKNNSYRSDPVMLGTVCSL